MLGKWQALRTVFWPLMLSKQTNKQVVKIAASLPLSLTKIKEKVFFRNNEGVAAKSNGLNPSEVIRAMINAVCLELDTLHCRTVEWLCGMEQLDLDCRSWLVGFWTTLISVDDLKSFFASRVCKDDLVAWYPLNPIECCF